MMTLIWNQYHLQDLVHYEYQRNYLIYAVRLDI
jgi:hypothetical protein